VSSRRIAAMVLFGALLLPQAATAQFGGFSLPSIPRPSSSSSSSTSTETGCKSPKKKAGAAIFGKIIGDAAGRTISRTGASRFLPVSEFSSTLTEAIACRLDPVEQKQAADATVEATRSAKVGSSADWTSETRSNVTGSSTVTGVMVTDVIIVDGEETRANKKMCRAKGAKGYALAA
jgi:surface antigen